MTEFRSIQRQHNFLRNGRKPVFTPLKQIAVTLQEREKITVRGRKTDTKSGSTQQVLTLIQAMQPTDVTAM